MFTHSTDPHKQNEEREPQTSGTMERRKNSGTNDATTGKKKKGNPAPQVSMARQPGKGKKGAPKAKALVVAPKAPKRQTRY